MVQSLNPDIDDRSMIDVRRKRTFDNFSSEYSKPRITKRAKTRPPPVSGAKRKTRDMSSSNDSSIPDKKQRLKLLQKKNRKIFIIPQGWYV